MSIRTVDYTGRVTGYALVDLRQLGDYDWRLSDRNVWKVERIRCSTIRRRLPAPTNASTACGGATSRTGDGSDRSRYAPPDGSVDGAANKAMLSAE